MKQYENPKMKIKNFNNECILLSASTDTMNALKVWQKENNGVVSHAEYKKTIKIMDFCL